jgi:hypothetical protein
MQHFFFNITCEDGHEQECDLVLPTQEEAEERLYSINEIGFTSLEDHKMVFRKMKSFQLLKVTDPHEDVSPSLWKSYNIPLTTLEDMLEKEKEYCLKEKDNPDKHWNKNTPEHNKKYGLCPTYNYWENQMLDSVKEDWGLDTPRTLEIKQRQKEFEQQYSKKYMSPARYRARKAAATKFSRKWNNWLAHNGSLAPYDKWTFQEMLEGCGYGSYYDKNENLVVLPCFDDETPELDENGYEPLEKWY